MFVFLHRRDPRDVVEGDRFEPEVRVVWDLVYCGQESREVGGRGAVDGCDEVCGGEAVLVGGGTAGLEFIC